TLGPLELPLDLIARRAPALQHVREAANLQPEVIEHGSLSAAGRGLLAEENHHPWNLDAGKSLALNRRRTELIDPERLVQLRILDVQVHVPHRYAGVVRRGQLRASRGGDRKRREYQGRDQQRSHDQLLSRRSSMTAHQHNAPAATPSPGP